MIGKLDTSAPKMKILIVTEMWPPHSGTFVVEQIKSLAPFISIVVVVLVPNPPNWRRYRSRRSPLTEMPEGPQLMPGFGAQVVIYYLQYHTIPELGKYLNSIQAYRVLLKFLQQHKSFDFIHAHFAYILGYAAVRAAQQLHLPVVVTAHGSDINYYTRRTPTNWAAAWPTIWGLRHATAVTVVCEDLREKILSFNVPAERMTIIPAGVQENIFFPRGEKKSLRQQLKLSEKDTILLFVGNLIPVKGLKFLFRAFKQVCEKHSSIKMIIIGGGDLEVSLKKFAHTLGIEPNIIWAGRKTHSEIPFWMSAVDFLVLPSLNEGYPMVVLEALACGTPVIASRVGGIPEILVSPDFGIMVPSCDSEALAQAILNVVSKNWDQTKLVAYARANTWAERAQRFLKVYHNVIKKTAATNRPRTQDSAP